MEYLNSHQACEVLGISYSTLWKLAKSKAFSSYKPHTGRNSRVYFDKEELLQYIKGRKEKESKDFKECDVAKMCFSVNAHLVKKLCAMESGIVGDLFKAILCYAVFGTQLETDNNLLDFVFDIFKQQIDDENERCKAIRSKRVEAGKSGAKQRWSK